MKVFKEFRFEAAHFLPNVPAGHQCGRMHGHSYRIRVEATGPVGEETGWVIDYADISAAVKPIIDSLDHTILNDHAGLENSTAENLAIFLWKELRDTVPWLSQIDVYETPTAGVSYRGGR